jgi:hypothetical protein
LSVFSREQLRTRVQIARTSGAAAGERALIPDEASETRRELERQFRGFVEMEDEAGYWAWLSLQPGFDVSSLAARRRAAEAWREAVAARRATSRRR